MASEEIETATNSEVATSDSVIIEQIELTEAVMASPQRDLVYNFWALTPRQRRTTMQELDLLEKDDDQLPETERYRKAFERAREREMLSDLEEMVKKKLAQ